MADGRNGIRDRQDQISPLLSVILATKNRPEKLKNSIESVLNQTFDDFELLVVDGSKDERSYSIIKEYCEKDKRVHYFRDKGESPAAARNIGLKESAGSYITFHDDDTVMFKDKLETLMNEFAGEEDLGVVYCARIDVDLRGKQHYTPGRFRCEKQGYSKNVYRKIVTRGMVDSSSAIIKKECFEKVGGFDESLKSAEDWDIYLRIAEHYKFKFINKPLYISYLSTNSLRFDVGKYEVSYKIIRDKIASHLKRTDKLFYLIYRPTLYYFSESVYKAYTTLRTRSGGLPQKY